MFDSVWFQCPACDDTIEVQSKAGACILMNFDAHSVPLQIAADIEGEFAYCDACHNTWKVTNKLEPPRRVPMVLV